MSKEVKKESKIIITFGGGKMDTQIINVIPTDVAIAAVRLQAIVLESLKETDTN